MKNTEEIIHFLIEEIEKSKSFLIVQREYYPENSVSVERAKTRLAEQERFLRVCYGM